MSQDTAFSAIDALVERLATVGWKERDPIKEELLRMAEAYSDRDAVKQHLEDAKREILSLEVRWEIDEVIEAITPPPPPAEEEPQEEAEDADRPLSAADLSLVYDDPRGLMLHKTKKGDRWFATQRDPRTGQPQTFELHPAEIQQLKTQLKGSPYWVLGAGGVG